MLYQLSQLRRRAGRVLIRRWHVTLDPPVVANVLRLSGGGHVPGAHRHDELRRAGASGLELRQLSARGPHHRDQAADVRAATLVGAQQRSGHHGRAGAGRRAAGPSERSVRLAGKYNMLLLGLVSVAFLLMAPQIVGTVSSDPAVLAQGIL
ncbi:MAG TPA: hypothetical protein VN719_09885, partial [Gemmatimonadales bacterium]|nr:hypothetical protein [Gemmatimonadales bacterium]